MMKSRALIGAFALFAMVSACADPTPTKQPSRLDVIHVTVTALAVKSEATQRACHGSGHYGPKNCATATVETRIGRAAETANAGGCFRRWDCNATIAAILTGTPPAP
ncbi:MAG: hypothetical protein ABI780_12010 [Ardenticatenales bacterium]